MNSIPSPYAFHKPCNLLTISVLLDKEPALGGKTTNDDDKRVAGRIMSLRLFEYVEMTRADVVAWTRGVTHPST